MRRRGAIAVLWVVLPAGFVLGLAQLFMLRFDAGDVYPAYSSLRPDPLGAKAVCEALGRVRGMSIERNYAPLRALSGGPGAALFVLGAGARDLRTATIDDVQSVEAFASGGGRVVISLNDTGGAHRAPADGGEGDPFKAFQGLADLGRRWGFAIAWTAPTADQATETAELKADGIDLPHYVTWKKGLFFDSLFPDWTTVYAREGSPVVVERPYGEGSIVLLASSHLLSNEAMRRERHAAIISWLVGPASRVVFDESHMGIREESGLADLVKRYRLQWLLGVCLALMALYVWQNLSPFTPPDDSGTERDERAEGMGSATGFVNLLRRSIPAGKILAACLDEWERTYPRESGTPKAGRMRAALGDGAAGARADPVAGYNAMSRIANERKGGYGSRHRTAKRDPDPRP
ncbi:MAG: DUF4350 domain-containing protein [Deltaproteobacteria bacterium]|nr:DUF4350 domain-containing protein [Deltaproteobacteria bacterium]